MQNINNQILIIILLFINGCTELTVVCPECDTETVIEDNRTAEHLTTDNKKAEQLQDDSETAQLQDDSETAQLQDDSETAQLQEDSETNPIERILDDCTDMQDFFTFCYNNSPGFSGPTYTQMESVCGGKTVYDWFARSHDCWEMPLTVSECDGADLDTTNDCVHFMACMENCGL
jgi:hypothetical protein